MIELHGAHARAYACRTFKSPWGSPSCADLYDRYIRISYCTRTVVVVSLTVRRFGRTPLLPPPPVIPGEQTAVRPDRLAAKTGRCRMGLNCESNSKYPVFYRFRLMGSNEGIVKENPFRPVGAPVFFFLNNRYPY